MIWAIAIVIFVIVLWFRNKKKTSSRKLTVQHMIGGDHPVVTWDGMSQQGNVFRLVLEVAPINTDNASIEEQKAIWSNFFGLINTLSLPYKMVMQSQLFEMQDYIRDYDTSVAQLSDDYPALKESGRMVSAYMDESLEHESIRDYRGYFILEYDPVQAAKVNGVQIGISKVDAALGQLGSSQNRLSNEEKTELALQMLEEAAENVFSFCEQIGMRYLRLDRAGVWNYTYQTLNRELSSQARMIDAMMKDSFKRTKTSMSMKGDMSSEEEIA
ncbi:hypothetical protein PQ460_10765 [Paenibacillus sp. KACC 21273]|uniref:hypothetical protein n=1 Tax=Paenibacillus sp. KACC 21273 TaxID=3025665 RepID=UPI002365EDB4|nr:hypothetical protein [Paenibacillus sp. KACC 21273]WDF52865.1 hypothetical protein PQ460_10765 [Paenibacillus sp. KACC 21273]